MANLKFPLLVVSDPAGRIYNHPSLKMIGRSGDGMALPSPHELIPLPQGSQLFTMPGRIPVAWDDDTEAFTSLKSLRIGRGEVECTAVAAFLPPGYIRTLLPATQLRPGAITLPLYAYGAVGWKNGKFWATGVLIDSNPHWNPRYFQNDRVLVGKVNTAIRKEPKNRLIKQLARCALEYHCFAAKNVFFRRWECPLPTSPSCNANCLGCISLQPSESCPASQQRIDFIPTPNEVIGVALPHLEGAENAIVSFGQGCEGEPLMQWRLLVQSIQKLRTKTDRGTINLNTNGSFPKRVGELCNAGLDSIRVTLSSPHSEYYRRYHRPRGYALKDVIDTLLLAKKKGIYTSINLLVLPGFTDRESEVAALIEFIRNTQVDLIQLRNLNIDPDLYLKAMGEGKGMGIPKMIDILKSDFPSLQLGYFNRTRDSFYCCERSPQAKLSE